MLDTKIENEEKQEVKVVETVNRFESLPHFVQQMISIIPDFKTLFLFQNPRFWDKGYVDYLPDFETDEEVAQSGNAPRFYWRYVGWNNGRKYTGEALRTIRAQRGVGSSKKRKEIQSA